MIEKDKIHARFKDAPWYVAQEIIVGGVGGIGSWLSFLLSRADHSLYLYDMDTVDLSNIGGQLFSSDDVGKLKTEAIKQMIKKYSFNLQIETFGRYEETSMTSNIMFSCFDNMAARKIMVTNWYNYQMSKEIRDQKEVNVFIDGRLEAESLIIYALKSSTDYNRYMNEFFDDSQVPDAPCTFRATSHNAALIAGNMVAILNNLITNKVEGMEVRDVPYKIKYQLPTFTHQAEVYV